MKRGRWAVNVCLLCALSLLQGCPAKPRSHGLRFPITAGFHMTLPPRDEAILIWSDGPLTTLAVEWLNAHHYSTILMPHRSPFEPHPITHNFSTRSAALAVASEMKAKTVIVVQYEATKDGALIEPDCGPLFHVSVEVRGLSIEDGETTLRGHAHYPHCVDLTDRTLRSLTCQAFATAWGFRPSGQLEIPSNLMCTAGQTEPMPLR